MKRDEIRAGDVVSYTPLPQFPGQRDTRWCREGIAVTGTRDDGSFYLADTFWGMGDDRHIVTDAEMESARLIFNVNDYDELPRYQYASSRAKWEKYAPADRQVITSQHGLERRWFIRKGATEDWPTKTQNARDALEDALSKLRSAQRDVEYRTAQLAEIQAAAFASSVPAPVGLPKPRRHRETDCC